MADVTDFQNGPWNSWCYSALTAFERLQRETYARDDIVPSLFLAGRVLEIKTMDGAGSTREIAPTIEYRAFHSSRDCE
jgi:hypothetical protein